MENCIRLYYILFQARHDRMMEVEKSFDDMQARKAELQQELSELKKQFSRIASGEDEHLHAKSQLQTEVNSFHKPQGESLQNQSTMTMLICFIERSQTLHPACLTDNNCVD